MDKSQLRIRPGFLLGLLAFFTCFVWLVFTGVPTQKDKMKAQKINTMSEERIMAQLLQEHAFKLGGLTNLSKEFVLDSFQDAGAYQYVFATRTNAAGEPIDIWETSYRFELAGPTNFVIRSAGKNQKFGDEDDIVFNSASNVFVKP